MQGVIGAVRTVKHNQSSEKRRYNGKTNFGVISRGDHDWE